MFNTSIATGQLYYLREHRRTNVVIDEKLRGKTQMLISMIRELMAAGITPAAEYEKRKCDRCSMLDLCMPKSTGRGNKSVARYIQTQLNHVQKDGAG
jgi:CRISPR-associated exonuclease Cas4